MKNCPICKQMLQPGHYLCPACGADLSDPDVLAMAPGDSTELPQSSLGEAGALSERKFLRATTDSIRSGAAMRTLGLVGGIFLVLAFLIPVSADFRHWMWPREALDRGPTFAVLLPLVTGLVGIAAALIPRLDNWVRAAVLVLCGLLGIFFCLPPLGEFAGTAFAATPLLTLGLLVAGSALAGRLYFPRSQAVRLALIGGTVVTVIALFVPMAKTYTALPIELPIYIANPFKEMSLFSALSKGAGHDVMVRFLSLYALLPLVLLPTAAALAWPTPGGVWDKMGTALRPIAWVAVLYLPLGYALQAFNVAGWTNFPDVMARGVWVEFDDFTQALMLGRARLALVSAFFVVWTQIGAVVLFDYVRGRRAATT